MVIDVGCTDRRTVGGALVVPLPPPYPPPQAEPASARSEAAIGRSFFAAKLKQFIADTVTSVISLGGARLYAPFQDEFSDDRYECRRGRQPFSRELALYESAHPVTVHQRWVTGTKVFGQRCQGRGSINLTSLGLSHIFRIYAK
jgi:hypothetical protein